MNKHVWAAALCVAALSVSCASDEEPNTLAAEDDESGAETSAPETAVTEVPAGAGDDSAENPFGGDDPEDELMPNLVCMDLQSAQNEIQDHGVFLSGSTDMTGQDRNQIIDSNWVVITQVPDAGAPIGEGDAELGVVKFGEEGTFGMSC